MNKYAGSRTKLVYPITKPDLKAFGDRVRQTREARGYSQEQTAELAGISFFYYRRIENGMHHPGAFLTVNLARELHV